MNTAFLDIFGLPSKSKHVLIDLIAHGISSVAVISRRLNMPKSTIYDALTPLIEQSLINEYSENHGKTFGVSEGGQLLRAHKEKIEELQKAQASLLSFITSHPKDTGVAKPTIKFYSGTLGIKQAFRDMPWRKDIKEAYMIWPTKDMISIDEEFFKWHGSQRFKYRVFIYAIEKHADRSLQRSTKHAWLKNDSRTNLASVRYLPKNINCKMSFWLYGDKCLFASGGAEKIAFTIHSKEFCDMIKLMWDGLWEKSRK